MNQKRIVREIRSWKLTGALYEQIMMLVRGHSYERDVCSYDDLHCLRRKGEIHLRQ